MIFSRNDPRPLAMTWITVCIQVGSPGIHLFCNVCLEQKGLNLVFKKRSVHNVHIDISFFGMMKCARQGANDFETELLPKAHCGAVGGNTEFKFNRAKTEEASF